MKSSLAVFGLAVLVLSCSARRSTVVYSERNFDELKKHTHIVVEHISGLTQTFYKMEVVKVDEEFVYAKCWKSKDAEPENFRFSKSEFVIKRSEEWHGSKTMTFLYSVGLTALVIGLIYVIDRAI